MTRVQVRYVATLPARFRRVFRAAFGGRKPLESIRAKCAECMAFQVGVARRCTIQTCPLWSCRMGKGKE